MRRRVAVPILLLLLAGCGGPPPPNIVLVIGDDHGYPYAGFTGSPVVRTPNLDALAAGGTSFRRAFTTASSCRPSHRTLLSGLHPEQWVATETALRTRAAERGELLARMDTLPRGLAARGYESFGGGKLWEGRSFAHAGFDQGTRNAPVGRRPPPGGVRFALGRDTMQPLWDFLDAAREPFFVWFAPQLPHSPFDAGAEDLALYADQPAAARAYYANVTRFDRVVGQLLARLDRDGLRERTLVVYLSDNGWTLQGRAGTAADAREQGKFSIAESGFHTPLIFRWPGRIAEGVVRDDLVSTLDLYPTLLGLAGAATPPGRAGVDLGPTLLKGRPSPRQEVIGAATTLRPHFVRTYFLRTNDWRYVWDRVHERRALHAIESDPDEELNLLDARPERAAELHARLERGLEQLDRAAPEVLAEPPGR